MRRWLVSFGEYERRTRPGGCLTALLGLIVGAVVGFSAGSMLGGLLMPLSEPVGAIVFVLLFIGGPVAGVLLARRWLGRTKVVLVCPHCGVPTPPDYRVCRSCGRVKPASS